MDCMSGCAILLIIKLKMMYIVEKYVPVERFDYIEQEQDFTFMWKPVRNIFGFVKRFKTEKEAIAFMKKKYDVRKDNVRVSELK